MISDNYVVGDNTYLKELQNFFFDVFGLMSITHYGAIGDGRTDNYGAIQVAIDDANRRGLSALYVPMGRFIYTGNFHNLGDLIFVGNPNAKIINIRTGEEIEVKPFCWFNMRVYSKTEINHLLSLLPDDYYELEYITNSSNQFITTKILAQPGIKLTATINIRALDSDIKIFGSHFEASKNMSIGVSTTRGWFMVVGGTTTYSDVIPSTETDYEIEFYVGASSQYLKVDGFNVATGTKSMSAAGLTNMYLFARNETSVVPARLRLYSAKLYVDDVLVRDFVGAKRKRDNEIGLYDKVSGLFFTSIGTGEFTAGSIVSNDT